MSIGAVLRAGDRRRETENIRHKIAWLLELGAWRQLARLISPGESALSIERVFLELQPVNRMIKTQRKSPLPGA